MWFKVWCEEARTSPNSFGWGYRRLPYVIRGHAIRPLMWIWFIKYCCYSIIIIIMNVKSLILTKIWRKRNTNEWSDRISEGSFASKIWERTKLYVKNLEMKSRYVEGNVEDWGIWRWVSFNWNVLYRVLEDCEYHSIEKCFSSFTSSFSLTWKCNMK